MTKIKNTKKGMAKKTLSISLAVAMLATSNVPVWAAEFTDGTDAAFTSEAPAEVVDEAPVVEETVENVPEATAMGDSWNITLPANMPKEVEWGSQSEIDLDVKNADGSAYETGLTYTWKNAQTGIGGKAETLPKDGKVKTPTTDEKNINESYVLYICDLTGDFEWTSPAITIGKQDISDAVGYKYTINVGSREYTGKETVKDATVTSDNGGKIKFNIDYTGDLVNVGTVSVTATPVDTTLYKGTLSKTFEIEKTAITAAMADASMATKEVVYTGNEIKLDKSDVAVADKNTGESLANLVESVSTTAKTVKKGNVATVALNAPADDNNFTAGTTATVTTKDTFDVVARDLSGVNVTIKSQGKKPTGAAFTKADFNADNVTFKDAEGNKLNLFNDVDIIVPENVKDFGTYTFTIKPRNNNTNVTGQTTAQFSIFSEDISSATFKNNSYATQAVEYTGSQITKDIEKLGNVTLNGKVLDPADYEIQFGSNVNAGTDAGEIYIIGKRTYEGSKAVIKFNINKAVVSDTTVADYVVYNKDAKKASDYAEEINLVVKAKNKTVNKEFTLVEGTDYTVDYTWSKNAPYQYVTTKITLKDSSNFKTSNGGVITKRVRIANNIIKDSDIQMKKTSYEYTGAIIVPEFDVIVDGKTLDPKTDYEIVPITNSANVGTATFGVKGKSGSDYDTNVIAKASFEITPASAESLEVKVDTNATYTGVAHKPELKDITITLKGNDVSSQFDITSYGENINAGKEAGSFVLTPKKDNKNFVADTSKTVKFDIVQANLTGKIRIFDERGFEITDKLPKFTYDGTEKEFAKVVFEPSVTGKMKVTEDDYTIDYINNVTGGGKNGASVIVIAKGNYKASGTLFDNATGTPVEVKNVVTSEDFTIESKEYFTEKEVTVSDAEYAGTGMLNKPEIVVRNGDKVLVEGKDYKVTLSGNGATNDGIVKDPSDAITYTWTVEGIGVYKDIVKPSTGTVGKNYASGTWKVVKKDVKNLDIKAEINEKGEVVLTAMNGNLKVDASNFTTTVSEDKKTVTVAATKGNKYYVGSTEINLSGDKTVGAPTIVNVKVDGNKATVVLADDVDNAIGYDYVIATENDYKNGRVDIVKNQIKTNGAFTYVQEGTYYAYCHAWRRDENNKKVFGEWSNIFKFEVESTTPDTPVITSVKRNGRNVTVTYKNAKNAEGYDIVLGSKRMRVNGELRPVEYGKLVQKNRTTTTVTFKNVPNGKYYVGMHAYNRTPDGGNKVFSRWANWNSSVTVK